MNHKIHTLILSLSLAAQSSTAAFAESAGYYKGICQINKEGGTAASVHWEQRSGAIMCALHGAIFRSGGRIWRYCAALQGAFSKPTDCLAVRFKYLTDKGPDIVDGPPVITVEYSSWKTPTKSEYLKVYVTPQQCEIEDDGDGKYTVTYWFTRVDARLPLIHRVAIVCPADRYIDTWKLQFQTGDQPEFGDLSTYVFRVRQDDIGKRDPIFEIY